MNSREMVDELQSVRTLLQCMGSLLGGPTKPRAVEAIDHAILVIQMLDVQKQKEKSNDFLKP